HRGGAVVVGGHADVDEGAAALQPGETLAGGDEAREQVVLQRGRLAGRERRGVERGRAEQVHAAVGQRRGGRAQRGDQAVAAQPHAHVARRIVVAEQREAPVRV